MILAAFSALFESAMIAACCVLCGWRLLHYFPLESYQLPGYFRSVKRNAQRLLLPGAAVAAAGTAAYLLGAMISIIIYVKGTHNIFLEGLLEKIQKALRDHGESAGVVFLDESADEVIAFRIPGF